MILYTETKIIEFLNHRRNLALQSPRFRILYVFLAEVRALLRAHRLLWTSMALRSCGLKGSLAVYSRRSHCKSSLTMISSKLFHESVVVDVVPEIDNIEGEGR